MIGILKRHLDRQGLKKKGMEVLYINHMQADGISSFGIMVGTDTVGQRNCSCAVLFYVLR